MKSVDFGAGLIGFRSPGDMAGYEIEVQKALGVSVIVQGKQLDQCGPIELKVNGETIKVLGREAGKIEFGPVKLPAGKAPIELFVSEDAKAGSSTCEVGRIVFRSNK